MTGRRGFLAQSQISSIETARSHLAKVPCSAKKLYDEALEVFASTVYGCLQVKLPKIYRFASPLACLLAIAYLKKLYSSPALGVSTIMTDVRNALTSVIGESRKIERARTIGRFLNLGLGASPEDQLSEIFKEAFLLQMADQCGENGHYSRLVEDFNPHSLLDKSWFDTVSNSETWIWPYSQFMVSSDGPVRAEFDDLDRPHCENDAAIEFSDGYRVWVWHGVIVPKTVILFPEALAFDHVEKEANLEIRRIMIERMTPGKYLKQAEAVLEDMDSLTLDGSAPRALMKDKLGNKWLVGTDGSTARVYTMSVPSDAKTCKEAHEMIAGFEENRLIAEA